MPKLRWKMAKDEDILATFDRIGVEVGHMPSALDARVTDVHIRLDEEVWGAPHSGTYASIQTADGSEVSYGGYARARITERVLPSAALARHDEAAKRAQDRALLAAAGVVQQAK